VELALLPDWFGALFAVTYVLGASFSTSSSWPRFCFPLSNFLAAHHLLLIIVTYDAKPDNSWRPCEDYSRFYVKTVKDSYSYPNVQDFMARLHGKSVFSKIDLVKGYHQVPMALLSVAKLLISPIWIV
jgi:hypothetical protein